MAIRSSGHDPRTVSRFSLLGDRLERVEFGGVNLDDSRYLRAHPDEADGASLTAQGRFRIRAGRVRDGRALSGRAEHGEEQA